MSKKYKLCGIGNAIVDILMDVEETEFKELNLDKGTMTLVEIETQGELLKRFEGRTPDLMSGGSVANSVVGFSQLGGDAAFIGCVGKDLFGQHYLNEFEELGIHMDLEPREEGSTGTSFIVITPDAERTMQTSLGVSSTLSSADIGTEVISLSKWAFIEGYLLSNPGGGQDAAKKVVELAKANNTKVALTLSAAFIMDLYPDLVKEIVGSTDLLFANHEEAAAYTGGLEPEAAVKKIAEEVPHVVVTAGADGVYIGLSGEVTRVPAFECTPEDLTGAGDIFAGSYLYGITSGMSPEESARGGCFLSMRVITQVGPRLHGDIKEGWSGAIAA